ncbi:MAG: SIS domain-containing protein, partial [Pseudomonadota bacterium]
FVDVLSEAYKKGHTVYCVACGTSFNAAKSGSAFFNYIAGVNVLPLLPGDFRSQCSNAVKNGDVILGISQSGETKDLIDIFNQVRAAGKKTANIVIVNNINSTLALEKSDLYIPLFCGAEVAVPATKSFINQLVVMYILALNVAERLGKDVKKYTDSLHMIPDLISRTIESTKDSIEEAADNLYLEPSIHILATGMQGIAREGALKVREVVLNHTEGYEAAEFKHGPNTILGVNTVFGMDSVRALLKKFSDTMSFALGKDGGKNLTSKSLHKLYKSVADYAFADIAPRDLDSKESDIFEEIFAKHNFFESLYTNYPLIFITGPSERDVNLTISQINTHKIRGADIYVIAEDNKNLNDAVTKAKSVKYSDEYKCGYITLPRTDDDLLPFFSSAVVLQLLALRMSIKKSALLERLEVKDHGVHPDTPKNVSKSITVD